MITYISSASFQPLDLLHFVHHDINNQHYFRLFSSSLAYVLHSLSYQSGSREPVSPREHSQAVQTTAFGGITLHKL